MSASPRCISNMAYSDRAHACALIDQKYCSSTCGVLPENSQPIERTAKSSAGLFVLPDAARAWPYIRRSQHMRNHFRISFVHTSLVAQPRFNDAGLRSNLVRRVVTPELIPGSGELHE